MRKITIFIAALIFNFQLSIINLNAQGVFQLPNPGFEQWDGDITSEPTHWNTFSSSDGTYASLASSNHHYRRAGHRPGGSGSYYLTIYTKSILGVKANGNMTTGRVHAGAMSASSSENYNYTQRSNSEHCQPFTATPDSMYLWVSFYASSGSSEAQVGAIIHGERDFISPNDESTPSFYKGRAVARFTRTTSSASTMEWRQIKVPFVYDGSSTAAYILINMTTNYVAGSGSANDSLSIDDIEFIYSAWLTDITVNGVSIPNFEKGIFNYNIHVDDISNFSTNNIDYTTEVVDATVEKSIAAIDDTTVKITLTVTAEDGITQKVYSVNVTSGISGDPQGIMTAENSGVVIFPNPASDIVCINACGNLQLVDMQGRIVLTHKCLGAESIDVSGLQHGTYIALVDNKKVGKIIKK
ncbi:MAG: T9SS type A sorting domain-containing protein [Bacteroidales bacterium]|nr:T9SS type A sorting domain-containing protein [Bacteroidales bacterium]